MDERNHHLDALQDIRKIMDKSSRFISLSGWSGVAAGVCALIAAAVAHSRIQNYQHAYGRDAGESTGTYILRGGGLQLGYELLLLAAITFVAAFILAFLFTWLRSRKTGVPIWGLTARRLMFHVAVPMIAGGIFILRLADLGYYAFIAPACLLFYGLGLLNASKYTIPEIRYLGFCQLVLGSLNLWMLGYGIYFWAIGFGALHIIYGIIMWTRYERNQ